MSFVLCSFTQSFAGLMPLKDCYTTANLVIYVEAILENSGNNIERILLYKKNIFNYF